MPSGSDPTPATPAPAGAAPTPARAAPRRRRPGWLVPVALVAALAVAPWLTPNAFVLYVATLTVMYAALSSSWNIMGGLTGYISLGHSFFFGLGAYFTGLTSARLDLSPGLMVLAAGVFVGLVAAGVGFVALRVKGASFVIVTLSLVYMGSLTAQGWRSLTGGSSGLTVPRLALTEQVGHLPFFYAFSLLFLAVLALTWWLRRSEFGRSLMAIREDEHKAEMLGIDTATLKLAAFVLSAVFVGVGGGLYAWWRVFLDPIFVFSITVSVNLILIALLGGVRSLWGPALGAVLFMPGSYWLLTTYPQIHLLLTGLLLGAIVLFLPDGIIPSLQARLARYRAPEASIRETDAGQDRELQDVTP